jgi:chemotaxis protein histidine kinase CheA
MGLAMVQDIIESNGGDNRVTSEPGKKTSFIIRLPAATGGSSEAVVQADPIASGTESVFYLSMINLQ